MKKPSFISALYKHSPNLQVIIIPVPPVAIQTYAEAKLCQVFKMEGRTYLLLVLALALTMLANESNAVFVSLHTCIFSELEVSTVKLMFFVTMYALIAN